MGSEEGRSPAAPRCTEALPKFSTGVFVGGGWGGQPAAGDRAGGRGAAAAPCAARRRREGLVAGAGQRAWWTRAGERGGVGGTAAELYAQARTARDWERRRGTKMVARTGGCGAFDYPAWPASAALVANAESTPVRAHLGTMFISVTAAKSRGREGVAAARPHVSAPHLQRSAQYRDPQANPNCPAPTAPQAPARAAPRRPSPPKSLTARSPSATAAVRPLACSRPTLTPHPPSPARATHSCPRACRPPTSSS